MAAFTLSDWLEFVLYAIREIVSYYFSVLQLGSLEFTLGEFLVVCGVLGVVARALILRSAHISENPTEINAPSRSGGASPSYTPITSTSYRIESHHNEYIDI